MDFTYLGLSILLLLCTDSVKSQGYPGEESAGNPYGNGGLPYPGGFPGGGAPRGGFGGRGGGGDGSLPPSGIPVPGRGPGPGGMMNPGSGPDQSIPSYNNDDPLFGNFHSSASGVEQTDETSQSEDSSPLDTPHGRNMQPGVPFPDQSFVSSFPDLGSEVGADFGVRQGSQLEPEDHITDNGANPGAGRDENDANGAINSELSGSIPPSGEAVKSRSFYKNTTVSVTGDDDDFNYVGMYVTVAIFITFIVTIVAIALIRGPQGPFKIKRSDDESGGNVNSGLGAEEVIGLTSDEGCNPRTDTQWEQQPLRSECVDAPAADQGNAAEVVCEDSTALTVNERQCEEEGV